MEKTAVTAVELFKSDCFPENAAWISFCKRYSEGKRNLVAVVDFISSEYCDKKGSKKEIEKELKEAIRIAETQTQGA